MTIPAALVIVGLLAANGFFVAFEFALVATRPTRLQTRGRDGGLAVQFAVAAQRRLSQYIAGVQLGVTMASLGLGFVAEPSVTSLLEPVFGWAPGSAQQAIAFAVAFALVIFLHTVLGELVPKALALAAEERALVLLAIPMRAFMFVFGPVVSVLNLLATGGLRLLRVQRRDELLAVHTADEIERMLEASAEEGLLEEEERRLLSGAIGIQDAPAAEVMVKRADIVMLRRTDTMADAEARVVGSGHSRLPMCGRDIDDVLGFVHAKDLLDASPDDRDRAVPLRLVRRMLVVGEGHSLAELLVSMRRTRMHVALVVDSDGRTVGMVTLQDVLNRLVGERRREGSHGARSKDR